ncbi:MAG: hypothetical protein PWQ59_80 [Thermoanaerobacterium sp.]|nr:hypothetical protein [Thermoanaerobacterium sp.]MDN5317398.1 hypothetical protein [Thermoanaerobacterium sp.]
MSLSIFFIKFSILYNLCLAVYHYLYELICISFINCIGGYIMININGLLKMVKKLFKRSKGYDKITLRLYGLDVEIERKTNIDVPHEVTVVVPRVELRKKTKGGEEDIEIIMNSITIVHSPRHKELGASPSPPNIPKRVNRE